MLDDINKVKSELGVIKELKLVFNEVFSSTFCEKDPYVITEINWEKFHISVR